ncbi:hypothetical protein ACQ3G6_01690 [Allorhizobium undicola]|uniref:hypothetical protein n=1 Tax=Allorhizobium undicola TaxID=78527 RepID=UPI003D3325F6
MADFVAVIRRAVDGLSNNTPEMRVKVYEKARGAVRRQLENMTPRPPEEMLRRQLEKLEAAIADVEAEYAEALPPLEDDDAYQPPEPAAAPLPVFHAEPEPVPEPVHRPEPEPLAPAPAQRIVHEPEPLPVYEPPVEPELQRAEPEQPRPVEPEPEAAPHWAEAEPVVAAVVTHEPTVAPEPVAPDAPHYREVVQEPPAWGAPLTQTAAAAETAARPSPDDWMDQHLEAVDAHRAQPVSPHSVSPAVEEPVQPVRPVSMPAASAPAFDEASALSDFDAFVRESAAARRDPQPQAAPDLINFDDKSAPVSFGEAPAAASQTGDPDWMSDFAPPPKSEAAPARQKTKGVKKPTHSPEEMAAVLAKTNRKGKSGGKRGVLPYVVILALVLVVAGGGYYAFAHRDAVNGLLAKIGIGATTPSPSGSATAPAAGGQAQPASADAAASNRKFNQRLMPDGKEVDEGASTATPATGEGRSVAAQSAAAAGATPPVQAAAAPSTTPFTVPENGQKAYLYEERLGQTTPMTVQGYVVWSEVKETGDNGKAEPVIQGRITIPDRSLTALVTFKRNTDSSLPASHLLEVVFSTGEKFEGGSIDSVQRVAMKRTEQDRGDPIVAVPAKITDDTFMVAFNDFAEVVSRNVELLRTRDWIDIPVTYRNGRRALMTLDKGASGKPIFDNVIKEWAALSGGQNGG